MRSDNWNEQLGKVATSDVAIVTGNETPGGGSDLRPVTLRDFLKRAAEHGSYAGLGADVDLSLDALDQECSIRFQTTFLPVDESADGRSALEFATEAYNYNTLDDADPRNLLLLCTTQGVALQQDGKGAKRLYHHAVDAEGTTHRYWLEAEQSAHKVGGAQVETATEKADAIARGKATAAVIGTRAMGTRFNVLMTVQLPLQQQRKRAARYGGGGYTMCAPMMCAAMPASAMAQPNSMGFAFGAVAESTSAFNGGGMDSLVCDCMDGWEDLDEAHGSWEDLDEADESEVMGSALMGGMPAYQCDGFDLLSDISSARAAAPTPAPKVGKASAARVSRGAEVDTWQGLRVEAPQRHRSEHITVTVVIYNTVAGGVPSAEDVAAAVEDMEALYAATGAAGRLADGAFDFMTPELQVQDVMDAQAKLTTQPYTPPPAAVTAGDVFPTGCASEAVV
eukprot:COSAG01_NODE_1695_length_9464_cov_4.884677_13_plen_451_part_00